MLTLSGTDKNPVTSLVEILDQHITSTAWEGNLKAVCSAIFAPFMDKNLLTLDDL